MSYETFLGDCLESLAPSPPCDLIYLDPPFGPIGEDVYYGVGETFEEYLEYITDRVKHVTQGQKNFNLLLHVDPKASHYLKVELDKVFGRKNFKNEIIWCWSSPSVAKRHLPRKHGVILWWGVGDYVFNPERIPHKEGFSAPSTGSWAGKKATQEDLEEYLARGKLLEDWWTDIRATLVSHGEKRGWETQKPLKLLERIVKMFSNEGGLVVDPMMGSGTTGMAALRCGRRFRGADKSPDAFKIANGALSESELPFWMTEQPTPQTPGDG